MGGCDVRFDQGGVGWEGELAWAQRGLTEGQPGLSDLQVDGEVCLQAQVLDGDVGSGHSLQTGELPVAVEDPWAHKPQQERSR